MDSKKQPLQISKEFVSGKWIKVAFYQTKRGIVFRKIKKGE